MAAAALLCDGDWVRFGAGAGEWFRPRLIDQAATPTAARTSTITVAMTARAAGERSRGGLRPLPGRRRGPGCGPGCWPGCAPGCGGASGDGYGLVDPSG